MVVRNKIKNQRGFTLVELMTVVAIIGVLATVGVPQYRKIQRKAKRAEATLGLGVIASGEAGFYAEYNGYGDNLGGLGSELQTAPLNYNIGFLGTGTVGANTASGFKFCENGQAACVTGTTAIGAFPGYQTAKIQIQDPANAGTLSLISAPSSYFQAYVRSGSGTASGFTLVAGGVGSFNTASVVAATGTTPTFRAAALGNLYNQSTTNIAADVLTIDQQRVIKIEQDGT